MKNRIEIKQKSLNGAEALQAAKPILFNTEMVRAVQNGTKTATRRLMKPQPESVVKTLSRDKITPLFSLARFLCSNGEREWVEGIKMPYQEGDILYVRETWHPIGPIEARDYVYKADDPLGSDKWYPSIHIPKKAARIFLRVTGVHVERLQDIDGYGVLAEGIDNGKSNPAMGKRWENMQRMAYSELWNSTIKKSDLEKYGWDANPWVWVIEFEMLEVT